MACLGLLLILLDPKALMTEFSTNPHASAHSQHVLTDHALSTLRPLLRGIAMWHRERTRLVPVDPETEFDDIDLDAPLVPDPPAKVEFERALNGPYGAMPEAETLTPDQIVQAHVDMRDPWANGAGVENTAPLHQPPISKMIVAARFAAVLTCPDLLHDITAPRAVTLLAIPDSQDRKVAWKNLRNVLQRLADLCDDSDDSWRGFVTPVCTEESHTAKASSFTRKNDYEDAITGAVKSGQKVIALTPDAKTMSPILRATCERVLDCPTLSGQMIIEILRVTHTATGVLSEDALLRLLPQDSDIAALPEAVIEGAFHEPTTLRVAQAIYTASTRLSTSPSAATTRDDVVLNADTRAQVDRLVEDMVAWTSGQLDWTDVPSSVLFYGPPGNGKTLLASAIAGSLNIPLITTSYADCQKHGHQGDMLKALSEKVDAAIRAAPSVFFLDELDGFTHRDRPGRRSDYIVGIVNGLLEHLSRLNDTPGVIVLGATNFPDMIDPAVIRPGRFDLKIELSTPDRSAIMAVLKLALGKGAESIILPAIVDQLMGSSAAQVTALVREARSLARSHKTPLEQHHLESTAAKICPALDPNILWRVAVHEAGHIVVGHSLDLPIPELATITGTGGYISTDHATLHTADTALNQIALLLAGHASESTVLGTVCNGSALGDNSDLSRATALATKLLFEWGLHDRLTQVAYGSVRPFNTGDQNDRQVEDILQAQRKRAVEIIENRRQDHLRVASALMAHRELSHEAISALLDDSNDNQTNERARKPGDHDA